jgi:hypothetical protein
MLQPIQHGLLILISGLLMSGVAVAQESSVEFWPEIDLWYRISPQWRLSLYAPISKNVETKYREGNLILQGDYAFGTSKVIFFTRLFDENRAATIWPFMVRGGYLSGRSLDDQGANYSEDMAYAEFHARTPIKRNLMLSHRFRPELRWLGDDNELSYRIRYRFMAEKELQFKKMSLVPYVSVEPYYDSRYETVNRIRAIGGATYSGSPQYAIELNFTYQHDTRSSVTNLYALNIILHIFFERAKAFENTSGMGHPDPNQHLRFPEMPAAMK